MIMRLMRIGRFTLIVCLELGCCCLRSHAQKLEIFKLNPDIIDARLGQFAAKNDERMIRLEGLFQSVGCSSTQLQEQPIKHFKLGNVICMLSGSTDSLIIVGAHYDFYTRRGRGVVDNWSGASLLPSLYESLRTRQRHHTYLFIGFGEEEEGLFGSRSYLKQLSQEQRSKIQAMANLDSLGLSSTKVEMNRGDQKLINLIFRVSQTTGLPVSGMNVGVGMSDAVPFIEAKIPAISIHSVTQETLPILHSSSDLLGAIKLNDYHNTYLLIAYYLAALDEFAGK
jgi:Peptidase family M28